MKKNVAAVVEEMSAPVVEALGLELVDVEFVKEGGNWILRVYIDSPGGITHNDCEAVSRRLDVLLDEKDPVPYSYLLEVSSPGIARPLKKKRDFERFDGHKVQVTTFAPIDGSKKFIGKLGGVEGDRVIVEQDGLKTAIPLGQVASAKLLVEF